MKKFFYSFFAAVTLLFAVSSCSSEDVIENGTSTGDAVEVSFNLEMEGQTASRAIGDGLTAEYLYFGAYLKNGDDTYNYIETLKPTNLPADGTPIKFVDKKATVKLRLVKGQTYRFFFWAQSTADENFYKIDFANHKVSVQLNEGNTASANNEKRDAFYNTTDPITVTGPLTKPITLKRPFAQVNVGVPVGDLVEAKNAGIEITQSSFTFENVATALNVFDGTTSEPLKITYHNVAIPESDKTDKVGDLKKVENVDYEYIAMNYVLPLNESSETAMTDAAFTVYSGEGQDLLAINTWEVPNLTIQKNWRTNIITSLIDDAEFNIVIDPIFAGDHNYPDTDGEELAFAALNGGIVTLTKDINLTEPLEISASMVLNLNGYTLNGSLKVAENVSLAVNGGSIVNTNANTSGIVSNGSLTLDNVNITSARHALRIESGTVVIDGGTYKVDPTTIKTLHALNVGDDGTVANVTIKNGTFIGPKGTNADSGAAVNVYSGSTVTIEGGNFEGGELKTLSYGGTVSVSGGTFDQDPSALLDEGYLVIESNNKYYVVSSEDNVSVVAASKEELPKTADGTKIDTEVDENTTLFGDINVSASETNANSGYGATGVEVISGAVLDGQGNTLTVTDASTTWDCVIATTGGTIKNLTVAGAMRGIFMPGATADVYIDNVIFKNVIYTFNSDGGNKNYGVYISNSTLNGWTSHSDVHKEVVYTNCSFGKGSGYAYCRPYGPTSFVNCTFEDGFVVQPRGTVTFENCKIGGVALTAENLSTLVDGNYLSNASVK